MSRLCRDSCVKIWQGRSLAYQATVQIGQMAEINDVVYVPGKKTLVSHWLVAPYCGLCMAPLLLC